MSHFLILCIVLLPFTQLKGQNRSADSISVSINALNLSEDMSRISTKNDALYLLVYTWKDSSDLSEPLLHMSCVLTDSVRMEQRTKAWNASVANDFLLLLIERDSDRSLDQIDPVIRVHYSKILDGFRSRDYKLIKEYLGDEDLLGFTRFSFPESSEYHGEFKGVHRLDEFDYSIHLELK